jgi:hypothetical protein
MILPSSIMERITDNCLFSLLCILLGFTENHFWKLHKILSHLHTRFPTPFCSETGSCYIAQAGLKLTILLPPPECWDYRYEPLYQALYQNLLDGFCRCWTLSSSFSVWHIQSRTFFRMCVLPTYFSEQWGLPQASLKPSVHVFQLLQNAVSLLTFLPAGRVRECLLDPNLISLVTEF